LAHLRRWRYPRRVTTLAVLVVGLLGSSLAHALLPEGWRPSAAWLPLAAVGAYCVLRLDAYLGLGKRFKHSVMDRFGGDVDDAQTWAVATLAGGAVLVVVALLQRAVGA
jgi:hypothetical protein